ncbi:hypothetical protein BBP40_000171 [Aspergillus hancockii]|nr:hypothetical protein BBP40_000171 [Aspergillus hancockii]
METWYYGAHLLIDSTNYTHCAGPHPYFPVFLKTGISTSRHWATANGFTAILFSSFKVLTEGAFHFINLVIPGKEPYSSLKPAWGHQVEAKRAKSQLLILVDFAGSENKPQSIC